ncbi:hypothetical protein MYA_0542 [Burkholderia sp. KJ006]|nr:hypothetical protein MYA_0542 [Burkholderia sp. KJ006]
MPAARSGGRSPRRRAQPHPRTANCARRSRLSPILNDGTPVRRQTETGSS